MDGNTIKAIEIHLADTLSFLNKRFESIKTISGEEKEVCLYLIKNNMTLGLIVEDIKAQNTPDTDPLKISFKKLVDEFIELYDEFIETYPSKP